MKARDQGSMRTKLTSQQRFKAYSAQPVEKLNADQKAAIASLPILEAQSRELEDLIKSGGAVEVCSPSVPRRLISS